MNNDELAAAIADTIEHIKHTVPHAERMKLLNDHLGKLLKEQERRAVERGGNLLEEVSNEDQ